MKLHASYKPFYHCGFVEVIISWVLNTHERLFTTTSAKKGFYKRHCLNFFFYYIAIYHLFMSTFFHVSLDVYLSIPSMHMSLLSKKYSFLNPKCSLHPEVHCLTVFIQGHCRKISKLQIYYTFRCCSGINVMAKKSWSIREFKYFSYKLCKYND